MIAGSIAGLAVMLAIWFALGAEQGGAAIGSVLLNMAVFGAMLSYILQAVSFICSAGTSPASSGPSAARSAVRVPPSPSRSRS
jgi:ethanolamine permease